MVRGRRTRYRFDPRHGTCNFDSLFQAPMQCGYPTRQVAVAYVSKADLLHDRCEFDLSGKAVDGFRQIGVRGFLSGNPGPDAGQDTVEVKMKQGVQEWNHWPREFENHKDAVHLQDAAHFGEAERGILEISQSEGDGYGVERTRTERDSERVRFSSGNRSVQLSRPDFRESTRKHGMTEVGGNDADVETPVKLDCEIARSAAEIEAKRRGISAYVLLHLRCRDAAPPAIDRNGQNVIQEIVTVSNLPEHLPHSPAIGS